MAAKEGGALEKNPSHAHELIHQSEAKHIPAVSQRQKGDSQGHSGHTHTHKQALTDGCIHSDGGQTDGRTDGGRKGTLTDVCPSVSHRCTFQSRTKMRKVLTGDAQNGQRAHLFAQRRVTQQSKSSPVQVLVRHAYVLFEKKVMKYFLLAF